MEEKDYWIHCGVMDAFCEITAAGVKKLALSHPLNSKEELEELLPYATELCAKYGIHLYKEEQLLITDLFPYSMNKGKCNILFYKEERVLTAYLKLKERKQNALENGTYDEERIPIALAFGELLSYEKNSCLKKIQMNTEKEDFT